MEERCALCGCRVVRRRDTYARPTRAGRAHATRHHFVAERFFGRSANRRGVDRPRLFDQCPWGVQGEKGLFCYECHEELLHNPVLLPDDVESFASLVRRRRLGEARKPEDRGKIGGRIILLHEVIQAGLRALSGRRR